MARDHFIPAALMAQFSDAPKSPLRKSRLSVVRRNGVRANQSAESLGYANKLYDVDDDAFPTHGSRAVDQLWTQYERGLPSALERLVTGKTTALDLTETLVPFVAATFARDRGYKRRVENRIARHANHPSRSVGLGFDAEGLLLDATNISINRVIEFDRFAARALACDWTVYTVDGDVILPDVGYGFDLVQENPDIVAMVLPLGRRSVLSLTPQPSRTILEHSRDGWKPAISYDKCAASAGDLNRELAKAAQDFAVGTEWATTDIEPDTLGVFDSAGIDEILGQWPFSVDTLLLRGLHHVVADIVRGEVISLDDVFLDPYRSIGELEPDGTILHATRRIPASRFLSLHAGRLMIGVD